MVGLHDTSLGIHCPEITRVLVTVLVVGPSDAAPPDWRPVVHQDGAFGVLAVRKGAGSDHLVIVEVEVHLELMRHSAPLEGRAADSFDGRGLDLKGRLGEDLDAAEDQVDVVFHTHAHPLLVDHLNLSNKE